MTTKDERRVFLIEAARDVVLRFGYRKTTLDDIATEAGVSRATLYNYFTNKDDLIRQIAELEIERLREAMAHAIDPEAPPEVRLKSLVRARYAHLHKLRALYRVVMGIAREVLPVAREEMEAFRADQLTGLTALLQEGIDSGRFKLFDPHLFAQALLSALRGIDEAYMFEDADAVAEGAALLADTLMDGLLVEGAP